MPRLVPGIERRTPAGQGAAAPYAAHTRGYYRALSASSVGIELAISVVIGMFFGQWLDGKLGTTPWMTIGWLCVGFAAGLRSIYRHVREADRDAARAEAASANLPGAGVRGANG